MGGAIVRFKKFILPGFSPKMMLKSKEIEARLSNA